MPPRPETHLRRLERLSARMRAVEAELDRLRGERDAEMVAARDAGVTFADMSRALGVSRQRVQDMFERLARLGRDG